MFTRTTKEVTRAPSVRNIWARSCNRYTDTASGHLLAIAREACAVATKINPFDTLTARGSLVQADCHVATARRRRVTGARSGADAVAMSVEVRVGFTLGDVASSAPTPKGHHGVRDRSLK